MDEVETPATIGREASYVTAAWFRYLCKIASSEGQNPSMFGAKELVKGQCLVLVVGPGDRCQL
jgi:hypothetical protein